MTRWERGLTRLYLVVGVGGWLFFCLVFLPHKLASDKFETWMIYSQNGYDGAAEAKAQANYRYQLKALLSDGEAVAAITLIPVSGYALLWLAMKSGAWIWRGFAKPPT